MLGGNLLPDMIAAISIPIGPPTLEKYKVLEPLEADEFSFLF
jgi:hypothetical protein